MISGAEDPYVLCVSFPAYADTGPLQEALADAPRPVQVVAAHFEDPAVVRLAKGAGDPRSTWAAKEGTITSQYTSAIARTHALLALDVPHNLIELAPHLALLQAFGSGTEHLPGEDLAAAGVALTNAAGLGAAGIAEFVIGRVLEVKKRSRKLEEFQRARNWEYSPGELLEGSTLAIIGLGAIGRRVARLAHAFGTSVLAVRRSYTPGSTDTDADELVGPDQLESVLRRADIVVLSAPDSPETADLINETSLSWLKPSAILCNVARGGLVDETALVNSLESGRLAAAILDVTKSEPPAPDSRLWTAPNLYLSPHSANSMDGYGARVTDLFATNVRRLMLGDPLINLVQRTQP